MDAMTENTGGLEGLEGLEDVVLGRMESGVDIAFVRLFHGY